MRRSAPKATTSACACSSAAAPRWCRPMTSPATSRSSRSARWRWRRSRPTTSSRASPIPPCWRRRGPSSICSIPNCRRSPCSRTARCAPRRRVLRSRASPNRKAPPRRPASAAWCWSRAMASTAPISSPAAASACRRSPAKAPRWRPTTTIPARCMPPILNRLKRSDAPPANARWRGSIRARSRPPRFRSSTTSGCRARWSGISPARSTAVRSRARPASSRTSAASGCSVRASASSTIRCASAGSARGRSTRRASPAAPSR